MSGLVKNALPSLDNIAGHGIPTRTKLYYVGGKFRQPVYYQHTSKKDSLSRPRLQQKRRSYVTRPPASSEQERKPSPLPPPPRTLSSPSPITIPYPFTTGHDPARPFRPPTKSEIESHLRPHSRTRANHDSNKNVRPAVHVGTVTKVGTMASTVQISYNQQSFDKWFKRHIQRTMRVLAHEPSGYLRQGDVVEFARFSAATMAERYEMGKLDRRGGGVRHEVHRVVTPFGAQDVKDRPGWPVDGEVADRFGDVEVDRRKADLIRPWNRDGERRVAVLNAMLDAVAMEIDRVTCGALLSPLSPRSKIQTLSRLQALQNKRLDPIFR